MNEHLKVNLYILVVSRGLPSSASRCATLHSETMFGCMVASDLVESFWRSILHQTTRASVRMTLGTAHLMCKCICVS